MRTSEAARYARGAAAAAVLLTVIVAGVYGVRFWQARQARKEAPPAVPPAVKQRSEVFSFSKVEGDRTLFTVRASRATEFKERVKLDDVWITIYGRRGKRFDNLHASSCDYTPETGRIHCAGEVRFDLESAEEARERLGQRVIHIRTAAVSFDRETGQAHTDQPVAFRFPYGDGRGIGVTYSTRDATLRLHRDVEFTLAPAVKPGQPAQPALERIVLTGSSVEYHRDTRTLRLLPPVRVQQGPREMLAGDVALEFDAALRASRLLVSGNPVLRSRETSGEVSLTAGQFVAQFHPQGWTERVLAEGKVSGARKGPGGDDRLDAQHLELELEPTRNEPRRLMATGNVVLQALPGRGEANRRLETQNLLVVFSSDAARGKQRVVRAETQAPGVLTFSSATDTTRVRGERLAADFDTRSRIRRLVGSSGVEVEREYRGGPRQASRSQELEMAFGAGGEWTEVEQRGRVQFREGDRSAQAERARLLRATDTITLTGSATVADSLTRTTADALAINQRTGEIAGDGNVRTSYHAAERDGITNLDSQPAHLSADRLRAHRTSGRALYSGRARLWQGEAVIEASSIELFRDARRLEARGGVQGLFPQSPAGYAGETPVAAGANLWRFRSASLTYWGAESRVRLEENVLAQSRIGQINSPAMDLYLAADRGGPQRLARALATGGVNVRQGPRRGTSERAEYVVADGKFVLSGGTPTLFDPARGTTTGRQLTFFLADDRIVIDSEEGSRTLTKHRVEK